MPCLSHALHNSLAYPMLQLDEWNLHWLVMMLLPQEFLWYFSLIPRPMHCQLFNVAHWKAGGPGKQIMCGLSHVCYFAYQALLVFSAQHWKAGNGPEGRTMIVKVCIAKHHNYDNMCNIVVSQASTHSWVSIHVPNFKESMLLLPIQTYMQFISRVSKHPCRPKSRVMFVPMGAYSGHYSIVHDTKWIRKTV